MTADAVFPVSPEWAARARLDRAGAAALHAAEQADPEAFWAEQARRLDWLRAPTDIKDVSFAADDFRIRWFADGTLNVSANCVDRHLATRADEVAVVWEGDDASEQRRVTYRELHREVCRFANVLKAYGVARGDRVTIYLPMIPEAAYAMLACARIGAVHSVVFGGFSPDAIGGRITDCGSRVVVTADEGRRAGKAVPLKANVDAAVAHLPEVETVLVIARTGADVPMTAGATLPMRTPPRLCRTTARPSR
jgi:acetyl-CoA synthetase